jgi:hypothetical protein
MGEPVRDINDLADILQSRDGERIWPIVVERRGRRYETALRLY